MADDGPRPSGLQVTPLAPTDPLARRCLDEYVRELAGRFDTGFDPARSLPATDDDLTPPAQVLLIAVQAGEPVGCVALELHGADPAEIKRMWVAKTARGLGLGRRLLHAAEARAVSQGVSVLRLETNRSVTEAIRLYRSAGYREVRRSTTRATRITGARSTWARDGDSGGFRRRLDRSGSLRR